MPDSSSLVPWVTALLGCAVSYVVARLNPRELSFFSALVAGAKAFALSIASFFVGSLLHGICINALLRCTSHGDGNISYAMGGVLAFPLFWLIMVVSGRVPEAEPVRSISNQCEAACSAAFMQHLEGKPDSSLCPACKQVIATKRHESDVREAHVTTRCRCGKCDKKLRLRPIEA